MTFSVLTYYPNTPAQCKNCGSANRFPIVDMGWVEEFYGSVYLCITCVEELAAVVGFKSETQISDLTSSITNIQNINDTLTIETTITHSVIEALKPIIDHRTKQIKETYKQKYSKELATFDIENEALRNDYIKYMDSVDTRISDAVQLAISNYEIELKKLAVDTGDESPESKSTGKSKSGQSKPIELSSSEKSGNLQSNDSNSITNIDL